MKIIFRVFVCFLLVMALGACAGRDRKDRKKRGIRTVEIEATGYCACQKCCGWKRNLLGQPVYAYGKSKGKRKKIGVTSSGTDAKEGTIAADISIYPYGTRMNVPGYGWGTVEDIGGAIKGERIDLFFESHQDALVWGRQNVEIEVILPGEGGSGASKIGRKKKKRKFPKPPKLPKPFS